MTVTEGVAEGGQVVPMTAGLSFGVTDDADQFLVESMRADVDLVFHVSLLVTVNTCSNVSVNAGVIVHVTAVCL